MPQPGKSPVSPLAVVAIVVVIGVIFLVSRSSSHQGNGPSGTPAGPSSVPTAAAPAWVTLQDPFEQAFTVEVPQGWTAVGGLLRVGFSDWRIVVDVTSPDRQTEVRLGDVIPINYLGPSPGYAQEGQVVDLGLEGQPVAANYRSGPEFAVLYAHVRFYQTCPNPAADTADVNFSIPDYLSGAEPYFSASVTGQQTSIGRIAYSCNAGQKIAFADTRTTVVQGTTWWTPTLGSFIASPAEAPLARTVLLHLAQTFKLSAQWQNYQQQMDSEGEQYAVARQQAQMAQLGQWVQQFEQQMAQEQQNFQNLDNALIGQTATIDPMTGQAANVWTGPNSEYWVDGAGNVVNTNGDPGIGYHQLQVTSP
jgi:hypothetical protein